jgi:Flp pilus assembly pilin Flp
MKGLVMPKLWGDVCRGEEAQDLIEYSLLLAAVALAGAAAIISMGNISTGIWTKVNSRLANSNGP